jgi:hypothetical protein
MPPNFCVLVSSIFVVEGFRRRMGEADVLIAAAAAFGHQRPQMGTRRKDVLIRERALTGWE